MHRAAGENQAHRGPLSLNRKQGDPQPDFIAQPLAQIKAEAGGL